MTGDRHVHQQQPIADQHHRRERDLPDDAQIEHHNSRDEIADGNRLQRVRKQVQRRQIEVEQVALHHHP